MCTFLFWMVYCGIWDGYIVEFVYLVYSGTLYNWIIIVISEDLTPVFAPRQQHFMNWRSMCTVTPGASAWSGGIMGKISHLCSIKVWYFTNWVDHRLMGSRNIHAMVLRFVIFYLLYDFTVVIAAPRKYRLWLYFLIISVKLSLISMPRFSVMPCARKVLSRRVWTTLWWTLVVGGKPYSAG